MLFKCNTFLYLIGYLIKITIFCKEFFFLIFRYGSNALLRIKTNLADNVGSKVRLKSKHGRKQVVIREGVIENTYPSIFTVKLDNLDDIPTAERRVSYSYADVLTKSVELYIYEPTEEN